MFASKGITAFARDVMLHMWVNGRRLGDGQARMRLADIDLDVTTNMQENVWRLDGDGWTMIAGRDMEQGHITGDAARALRELSMIRMADVLKSTPNLKRLDA